MSERRRVTVTRHRSGEEPVVDDSTRAMTAGQRIELAWKLTASQWRIEDLPGESRFDEMLRELSDAGVEFLVVGAHARAAYGEPRATKDLDIWVRPSPENARRVMAALGKFGAPLEDIAEADFAAPGVTYQIGVDPVRIDILTELTGLSFDDAWQNRADADFGGGRYAVIGKREFVINKRATGRAQDLADAEHVEKSLID